MGQVDSILGPALAGAVFMMVSSASIDCPSLVREIDRVMQRAKMMPGVQREVQHLRDRGAGLHEAGQHPQCLAPLIEAAQILGITTESIRKPPSANQSR